MLAIWSLVPLPFLNPACTSGSPSLPTWKCWWTSQASYRPFPRTPYKEPKQTSPLTRMAKALQPCTSVSALIYSSCAFQYCCLESEFQAHLLSLSSDTVSSFLLLQEFWDSVWVNLAWKRRGGLQAEGPPFWMPLWTMMCKAEAIRPATSGLNNPLLTQVRSEETLGAEEAGKSSLTLIPPSSCELKENGWVIQTKH